MEPENKRGSQVKSWVGMFSEEEQLMQKVLR